MIESLKNLFSILGVFAVFLVVPQRGELPWIDTPEERWYGELALAGEDGVFIMAKNSAEVDITLPENFLTKQLSAIALRDGELVGNVGLNSVPRQTYSLFQAKEIKGVDPARRSLGSQEGVVFLAGSLVVTTAAEEEVAILSLIAGVVLVALLSFLVGALIYRGEPLLPGKEPEQ